MESVRPQNSRAKSSGILRGIVLPKNPNRMSRDIAHDKALRPISGQPTQVPILPPDHPHSRVLGAENVDPMQERKSRSSRQDIDKEGGLKKRSKSAVSLRSLVGGGDDKKSRSKKRSEDEVPKERKQKSPKKPVKTKSSTGLSTMFAKMNRSSKNLSQPTEDSNAARPTSPVGEPVNTPIWAQYATSQESEDSLRMAGRQAITSEQKKQIQSEIDLYTPKDYSPSKQRNFQGAYQPTLSRPNSSGRPGNSERPKSAILTGAMPYLDVLGRQYSGDRAQLGSRGSDSSRKSARLENERGTKRSTERPRSMISDSGLRKTSTSSAEQPLTKPNLTVSKRGARVMAAVAVLNGKSKEAITTPDKALDPKTVDEDFERVLDARNVPENMRQKMRSLTLHVKADFIRQEKTASSRPSSPSKQDDKVALWSETTTDKIEEPDTHSLDRRATTEDTPTDQSPTKRIRPRSKTFTFSKGDTSPSKKQKAGSRPISVHGAEQLLTDIAPAQTSETPRSPVRKAAKAAFPDEFVAYLRKVRDPVETEVGRLHKLRLLLRNETVAWVDSFIALGGMTEIVDLLHRIMAIEWREEHEDQLLHETLLCLKGLCTTKVALKRLDEVADTLFPSLLTMLFDEEKKGPSEFTTRGVIISILFAHLNAVSQSAPEALTSRARTILEYLSDPKKPEDAQPVSFVLDMRQTRPYRIWGREVSNVTREVFWIFLHHMNVVPLPKTDDTATVETSTEDTNSIPPSPSDSATDLSQSYTKRHFPGSRPPVPAAPYIGGVEWDATTYMTTHLDLLNGLIASLPTTASRNELRAELKASGWEKVMGGTLRTCKEKFYSGVHDALRAWAAAAYEDGWDTRFVREGPSREEIAEAHNARRAASPKKKGDEAPKLEVKGMELPKLDLGLDSGTGSDGGNEAKEDDGWLA